MADRSVRVMFQASVQGLVRPMRAAQGEVGRLRREFEQGARRAREFERSMNDGATRTQRALARVAETDRARQRELARQMQESTRRQEEAMRRVSETDRARRRQMEQEIRRTGRTEREEIARNQRASSEQRRRAETEIRRSAARQQEAFRRLGQTGTAVGLGLAAGFLVSAKAAMDFDKAMSHVASVAQASSRELQGLREAALQAGRTTAYSAIQAAKGEEELAKAGVATKDILGGALKGALDLAAAGTLDVGEAAETAATAMVQFGLSGKDVPHIADLLSAGANKAQGSVHDLGFALKMGGLVGNQFGLSIEDTVGTLSAFASAGLIGRDAGTSFKTMLLHLASPTNKTKELMKDLGISVYDAQGQFVGITGLAEILRTKLSHLTEEQRNAALAQIFGTDAIRGANVLYKQGAAGIQGWIDKVNDSGNASRTAAKKLDNLAGDLQKLKGSITTALIGAGEGTQSPLRSLVQTINGAVNAFLAMPPAAQSATMVIAGTVGAALLSANALLFAGRTVRDLRVAYMALIPAATRARITLASVGKGAAIGAALVAATFGFYELAKASDHARRADLNVDKLAESFKDLGRAGKVTGELKRAFGEDLQGVTRGFAKDVEGLGKTIRQVADPSVSQAIDQWSARTWGRYVKFPQQATDKIKKLDASLANLVKGGNAVEAQRSFDRIAQEAAKQGISLEKLRSLFPQFNAAQRTAAVEARNHAESEKKVSRAMDLASASAEELEEQLNQLAGAAMSAERAAISQARAVQAANKASDRRRGLTLDEREALLELAEANQKVLVAEKANGATGDALAAMQAKLARQFVRVAMGMGRSRGEAEDLARKYGLLTGSTSTANSSISAYISRVRKSATATSNLAGAAVGAAGKTKIFRDSVAGNLPVLYALAGRNKAARDQVDALARSAGIATGRMSVSKEAFIAAAGGMKIARDKAEALWKEFNKIQSKDIDLGVSAKGSWTLMSRPVEKRYPFAAGGEVPFVSGSRAGHDSVPAMLMPNEHVWTTREVDAVGGHDAMYRMRAAARAGKLKGYAAGGKVDLTRSSTATAVKGVYDPIYDGMNALVAKIGDTFAAEWKKIAGSGGPVVAAARRWIGTPYSWGGGGIGGPSLGIGRGAGTVGFDCSGLTQYAWHAGKGVDIGGVTYSQHPNSTAIGSPRPGALGFNASLGHVVLASNKPGHVIEAPFTGGFVREVPKSMPDWRWPKNAGYAAGGKVARVGDQAIRARGADDVMALAQALGAAGSGPRRGEQHNAQIARGGDLRLWAEPETQGEAYIPLAASKRVRSTAILGKVANRFGLTLTRMADGGITGYADGGGDDEDLNLSEFLSTWQDLVNPAEWSDVTDARKNRKTQSDQVAAARRAIAKAKRDRADRIRTAQRRLARARRSGSRTRIREAKEDLAKAKRTDKIRDAERKLTKERQDLADATRKLADTEKRYQYAKLSPGNKLSAALDLGIKNTGAFIANLTKLSDRGFGVLARNLLAMGGTEAEKIAADAVKFSDSKLKGLQGKVTTAQKQQATLEALPNILTVRSSLKGLGTKGSSWVALLNATGLGAGDLAAAVKLMAGDLGKTATGKALLADMKAHGYARGGLITGPGGVDNVPIWATSGEYMINRRSASKHASLVAAVNADRVGDALLRNYIRAPRIPVRGGDGATASGVHVEQHFHHQAMNASQLAREAAREAAWQLG